MLSSEKLENIKNRLWLRDAVRPRHPNLGLDYQPGAGDVIIVSFPRSGRTWLMNILWSLHNKGQQYPEGKELFKEYLWLEVEGTEAAEKMKGSKTLLLYVPQKKCNHF